MRRAVPAMRRTTPAKASLPKARSVRCSVVRSPRAASRSHREFVPKSMKPTALDAMATAVTA
ncbi:hypothetical protein DZG00_01525 [Clavibacter lycopersici]|uniref:Uncharacterized protein n=1 Tax=Clavibacter lycopersici TaxID=2301718 RepID=A0A399TAV5_9MICO|nr:hypothetical protein DZG00_01525 [Clavibacter lycopersici]RIJ62390.1 hypothetical protein DZG02_02050 [Clavibacter lycopersici]